MQNLISKDFEGPKGTRAVFCFRPGNADECTIQATYRDDEYGFRNLPPGSGDCMIDAGGYIGSTAILYAQLYPDTKVVCIEPLPENAEIIRKNIEVNGLTDRIMFLERALTDTNEEEVEIYYRDESPVGVAHKFVGTSAKKYTESVGAQFVRVKTINLESILVKLLMKPVRVLKMDIEASEYKAFSKVPDHILDLIQTIVGEYHNPDQEMMKDPRTTLYNLVKKMFDDRSIGPENQFIGSFYFEKMP